MPRSRRRARILVRLLHVASAIREMVVMRRRLIPMIVCLVAVAFTPRAGSAQQAVKGGKNQRAGTSAPVDQRAVSGDELRKMLDTYAMMHAQEQLKISNEQFPKFLMQYKALQDMRRTTSQEHRKQLVELRKQAIDKASTDAQLKDRLKALHTFEDKSYSDVRKAYDDLDKLLDARQQARFRIFEQQMEQRLVQAARQTNGPKAVK